MPITQVGILQVGHRDEEAILWPKPLEIMVVRQVAVKVLVSVERAGCFVRPYSCNVFDRVTSSPKQHEWNAGFAEEANAIGVPVHREIVLTQAVAGQRVSTTLENDDAWLKAVQNLLHELESKEQKCESEGKSWT